MNRKAHKILWFLVKKFFACAPSCGKIMESRQTVRIEDIDSLGCTAVARVGTLPEADHSAQLRFCLSRQHQI